MNKIVILFIFLLSNIALQFAQDIDQFKANRIEWSLDGRYLAVNTLRSLWLYDLDTLQEAPYRIDGGDESYKFGVNFMRFDPYSHYFGYGSGPYLNIIDIQDKSRVLAISGEENVLIDYHGFGFSDDGTHLYTIGTNFRTKEAEKLFLNIWNVENNDETHRYEIGHAIPEFGGLSSDFSIISILPYDSSPVSDSDDPVSNLKLYNFDIDQGIGELIGELPFSGNIYTKQFSQVGTRYALSWLDGRINILNTQSGELVPEIQLKDRLCGDFGIRFTFSPDDTLLVIINICAGKMYIWNIENNQLVFEMDTQAGYSRFTSDSQKLLLADGDPSLQNNIYILDLKNDYALTRYQGGMPQLSPNDELMATIGSDGNIWIWNIKLEQLQLIIPVPQN